jgi:hypothetical protein
MALFQGMLVLLALAMLFSFLGALAGLTDPGPGQPLTGDMLIYDRVSFGCAVVLAALVVRRSLGWGNRVR